MKTWCAWAACLWLGGCTAWAYTNEPLNTGGKPPPESQASFDVQPRGNKDVMVLLALSGGGSRAAYFASEVMLRLEDAGLLQEVDAISSVSGGSLPAAYYCASRDEDDEDNPSPRVWEQKEVRDLMSNNYLRRWFGNLFWPFNIVRYWFMAFDRSDIMAQTFADNLFDHPLSGGDFTLGQLNRSRPYLILNATNATRNPAIPEDRPPRPEEKQYGSVFTFTREDFSELLGSDINEYSVARAVMASASFPAVFQDMTLRDYRIAKERFMHVFDGGNSDNLGLMSVKRVMRTAEESKQAGRKPDRYVVICVDSYTKPQGVDRDEADPRSVIDHFVDTNFMDSIDSLLTVSRWGVLLQFIQDKNEQERLLRQKLADGPAQESAEEGEPYGKLDTDEWVQSEQSNVPIASPIIPPEAFEQRAANAPTDDEGPPEANVGHAGDSGRDEKGDRRLPPGWQPRDLDEDQFLFWHIQFADVKTPGLKRELNGIATDFRLPDGATLHLENAATELVTDNEKMVNLVRKAVGLDPLPPRPSPPPQQ